MLAHVSNRIELIDLVRGLALLAMTVFHFAFDMELFGFVDPGFVSQPHWKYFARLIASTFLLLVGFSLFLAHYRKIRWASWRKRFLIIVGAALVITVATFFATPNQYIFFGILHMIAFASLACLAFLKLPWWLCTLIGVLVFWVGQNYDTVLLNDELFWWTGLQATIPVSSDYVPVFPWLSAPLLGMALARFLQERGVLAVLEGWHFNGRVGRGLKFVGRHSLIYYLLHQPVMIALIFGWVYTVRLFS